MSWFVGDYEAVEAEISGHASITTFNLTDEEKEEARRRAERRAEEGFYIGFAPPSAREE